MASYTFPATASAVLSPLRPYEQDIPELIARSELFSGLTRSACVQIAQLARMRLHARDEFVFEEGQPVRHVVLIVSGSIKMTQLNSSGSEVILWLRGPGEAVGIFGIPSQSKHTCSAQVIVKCRALSWEWSKLDALPASLRIRENIGCIMSERIRELETRFREVATEKVAARVALALLRILNQVGGPSAEGGAIFLSREDLAQLTGTTLFTVSRLLSRWSEQGILETRRETVLVRDPIRLLQTCSVNHKARLKLHLPAPETPLCSFL